MLGGSGSSGARSSRSSAQRNSEDANETDADETDASADEADSDAGEVDTNFETDDISKPFDYFFFVDARGFFAAGVGDLLYIEDVFNAIRIHASFLAPFLALSSSYHFCGLLVCFLLVAPNGRVFWFTFYNLDFGNPHCIEHIFSGTVLFCSLTIEYALSDRVFWFTFYTIDRNFLHPEFNFNICLCVGFSLSLCDISVLIRIVEQQQFLHSIFIGDTIGEGLARIAQSAALANVGTDDNGPGGDLDVPVPQRAASLDWSFPYDDSWGEGVVVYVVDGGVRTTHTEFGGPVENGFVVPGLTGVATEDVCRDGGHGTGVASLIAGKTLGIARKATIVPVRATDADGCKTETAATTPRIVDAVNWAVDDYNNRKCNYKGGIINISMTTRHTPASEQAFTAAKDAGLHVVVSAGNAGANECFEGPAPPDKKRVKDVGQLIVGNMDFEDQPLDLGGDGGSNFGPCLALWAPGSSMNVASSSGDAVIEHGGWDWSGTSYSAPLVSGTIAAMISSGGNKSPADMRAALLGRAFHNAGLKNLQDGSPDIVLQSLILSGTTQ
ncbi:peptidase S8/S53 domain-containing protein [Mycena rebaudengoi]|nr:peptidase S8/S53 domain-containing protein [Mycena rebaudengoi]